MPIEFTSPELTELKPKITVFGVGGAGGNAVNNMVKSKLSGVEFVVANTDAQALANAVAEQKIQLGAKLTQGLGAGARPEVGRAAAEETMETIEEHLEGVHMVFITAGMGGGTGTGAAPMIAEAARARGILTVGVVTKPFQFEGSRRMKLAEQGIEELSKHVDTLIIIPNQNLFRIANERTTMADAFSMADEVLHSGVRGITDLMIVPGLVNLDFADVRTVMSEMGKAMMGTGEAEGENRAIEAAEAAISNPLLDEVSMKGAAGVLINITGGMDLALFEVDEAANRIRSEVDPDANILVGTALDPELDGKMRVSVVATGIISDGETRREVPIKRYEFQSKPEVVAPDASAEKADVEVAELRTEPAIQEVKPIETPVLKRVEEVPLDLIEEARVENNDLISQLDVGIAPEAVKEVPSVRDDRDAPFIAPAPVLPEKSMGGFSAPSFRARSNARELEVKSDAFAEAALSNGMSAPIRKEKKTENKLGIFGSILSGKSRKKEEIKTEQGDLLQESNTQRRTEIREETVQEQVKPVAPRSPSMSSLNAGERITPETSKEDNLKIPAFLRRQAN